MYGFMMDEESIPDENGWSERDENIFFRTLEQQKVFRLEDSGYLETVLVCNTCGRRHRFSFREDAYDYLTNGRCDECEEEGRNDQWAHRN